MPAGLASELATTILCTRRQRHQRGLRYDSGGKVGIGAAKLSVGRQHSEPYRLQVRYASEDIIVVRRRVRELETDIERRAAQSISCGLVQQLS
jgi:hypothetical protein